MADESSGFDSVLKGLLGFTGGVLQRNLVGNILMSGLRGGVLGSRSGEAAPEDPNSGWGAYLGALTGLPSDAGWSKALPAPQPNPVASEWLQGKSAQNPALQAFLPSFMTNPMLSWGAAMDAAAPTPGSADPFAGAGGPVFAKPVDTNPDPLAFLSEPEIKKALAWMRPSR
ncbi:MAG: hypothetical protein KC933_23455 [Myxococcales bacterium]|nr:hypothetical protein [Myxococcales bacterium]